MENSRVGTDHSERESTCCLYEMALLNNELHNVTSSRVKLKIKTSAFTWHSSNTEML